MGLVESSRDGQKNRRGSRNAVTQETASPRSRPWRTWRTWRTWRPWRTCWTAEPYDPQRPVVCFEPQPSCWPTSGPPPAKPPRTSGVHEPRPRAEKSARAPGATAWPCTGPARTRLQAHWRPWRSTAIPHQPGSWLNMAENGSAVDATEMKTASVSAWRSENAIGATINWTFHCPRPRRKLHRLYPCQFIQGNTHMTSAPATLRYHLVVLSQREFDDTVHPHRASCCTCIWHWSWPLACNSAASTQLDQITPRRWECRSRQADHPGPGAGPG